MTTPQRHLLLLLIAASLPSFAQAPVSERFETLSDGSVRDNQTTLIWADKDNGGDVDWMSAQAYCQSLGADWKLPSADQLLELATNNPDNNQKCLGLFDCRITPLITLSGLTPWSSEVKDPYEAWYVYFGDRQKYSYKSTSTQGKRALCVRH